MVEITKVTEITEHIKEYGLSAPQTMVKILKAIDSLIREAGLDYPDYLARGNTENGRN